MIIFVLTAIFETGITLDAVPIVGFELGQAEFTALGVSMILLLIMGSGFFSSSEIAMFSLSPYQIDAMIEEGKRGAQAIKSLKSDPHRLLVTILVGNNLVNITMSSISTTIVGFYLDAGIAVIVSSLGITSIVLLFGESAPKSYAVDNTDSWARTVAPLLKIVGKILWPLITLFYYLTRLINKITPGGSSEHDQDGRARGYPRGGRTSDTRPHLTIHRCYCERNNDSSSRHVGDLRAADR